MPLDQLYDSGVPIIPLPDVQSTTLGLDVLSRFVCNTWDEATAGGTRLFDAIVIGAGMFGGYCADKIFRTGANNNLKVLVLDAGPFVVPTHVQNLPSAGLNVPDPILPSTDPGIARDLVWGMAWRGNVPFVGQAYCIGGKSLYWGGWCPRLLASDLAAWPPTVAQYLTQHYPLLEEQTGVSDDTQFIPGLSGLHPRPLQAVFCRARRLPQAGVLGVNRIGKVHSRPAHRPGEGPRRPASDIPAPASWKPDTAWRRLGSRQTVSGGKSHWPPIKETGAPGATKSSRKPFLLSSARRPCPLEPRQEPERLPAKGAWRQAPKRIPRPLDSATGRQARAASASISQRT